MIGHGRGNPACDLPHSRKAGNARRGSCHSLWRSHQGADPGRAAEPWTLPGRLHVSPYTTGGYKLEVTDCDLKFGASVGRPATLSLRLYRAGCCDAIECAAELSSHR